MSNERRLAETVRAACIEAALAAYEEGGVLGLCAEGRWEYAISALRQLDVNALLASHSLGSTIESHDGSRPEPPSDQLP